MSEHVAFEDPIGRYIAYLTRQTRTTDTTQWQAHQRAISRIVACEYGVTEEQLKWLDDNL